MGGAAAASGPDLRAGVSLAELTDGVPYAGRVDGEAVVLVRVGGEVFAVGGTCTHYGAPLGDGIVTGDVIRCPWHHACFSIRTGEAVAAPARDPLQSWAVEVREGRAFVTGPAASSQDAQGAAAGGSREPAAATSLSPADRNGASAREAVPQVLVIVGGGAAGHAAAETLRGEGFAGRVVIVDPDPDAGCDRPNLSKDYLAGNAPEEWLPLRPPEYFEENRIERVRQRATSLDAEGRRLTLEDGSSLAFDGLLLATGAAPIRLPVPGADLPHVHVLRTVADARGLIGAASGGARVVIAGASFIGMEAAASLRARGAAVTVVAPEELPFARTLGPVLGAHLRDAHAARGVEFRLGRTLREIAADRVVLDDGSELPADVVLLGVGVRPSLGLAETAGLASGGGVPVDRFLRTSAPGIYAAGDIAAYPDAFSGSRIRVEHWVVAQRQGQTAARNLLGAAQPYASIPFFWTHQYETGVCYVGHAAGWSDARVDGTPDRDCRIEYLDAEGRVVAVATVNRDRESLGAEVEMERATAARSHENPSGV